MPTTDKNEDQMYQELLAYGNQVKNPHLRGVIRYYFEDPAFCEEI